MEVLDKTKSLKSEYVSNRLIYNKNAVAIHVIDIGLSWDCENKPKQKLFCLILQNNFQWRQSWL